MASRSKPCVIATGLTHRYAASSTGALDNVNFSAEEGDFITLIGRSGCGKGALRCLTGLIPQASEGDMQGRVDICGLDTHFQPLFKLATVANMAMSTTPEG